MRIFIVIFGVVFAVAALRGAVFWVNYTQGPFYSQSPEKVVELARAVEGRLTAPASLQKPPQQSLDDEEKQQARAALRLIGKDSNQYAEAQRLIATIDEYDTLARALLQKQTQQEAAEKSAENERTRKNSVDRYANEAVAKAAVLSRLKDPGSAIFGNVNVYADRKLRGVSVIAVCGRVNAKNGFGGFTGMQEYVVVPEKNILAIDSEGDNSTFVSLWNSLCAGKHS